MQRLFSSFPNGRPGLGLFFLRLAAAVAMIIQALKWLMTMGGGAGSASALLIVAGALAVASAVLLLVGFMTPLVASVATVIALIAADSSVVYIVAINLAIVLLGPGALSIDARLYGRREIRIV